MRTRPAIDVLKPLGHDGVFLDVILWFLGEDSKVTVHLLSLQRRAGDWTRRRAWNEKL